MVGIEPLPVEQIKEIEESDLNGTKKKKKKRKDMKKYAPLIFEECYIKVKKISMNKILNSFEL